MREEHLQAARTDRTEHEPENQKEPEKLRPKYRKSAVCT